MLCRHRSRARSSALPPRLAAALGLLLLGAPAAAVAQRPLPRPAREVTLDEPIAVRARQTGPGEITVEWTAVEGATGYFVGRLAPPDGWRRLANTDRAAVVFVDRDVEPGRSYTYQVSALGAGRAGARFVSDTVLVTGGAGVPREEDRSETAAPTESRAGMVARVYEQGRAAEAHWWDRGAGRARPFWLATADASGLSEGELLASWREVAVAAQLYQHIFKRPPSQIELRRQLAAQRAGKSADEQWRELAQSAQRERELGAFGPAPMTMEQARGLFGFRNPRPGEQCFGGMGPGCTGGIPESYAWVQPRWQQHFRLPDGTEMAYVEIGIGVGSILHDNACLDLRPGEGGVACAGWELVADIGKHAGVPAALEWNKAAWSVMDGRGWRGVFGPYPVDLAERRYWYDDLRPAPARRSFMANVAGLITTPTQDQPYRGRERRASRLLEAPAGTTLDAVDVEFCASDAFAREEAPFGKAKLGVCR